jgi:hypothetical protein
MEFLKKMAAYGYIIPRILQMSLSDSERVDRFQSPVARMDARLSEYRERVFRGGDYESSTRMIYAEWNLARAVIDPTVRDPDKAKLFIPFFVIWVPKRYGGVGMLPWNWLDPNQDLLIMHPDYYPFPAEIRRQMNAWVMASQRTELRDSVGAIVKGLTDYFRDSAPKGAYHFENLDAGRLENSIRMEEQLARRNVKVSRPYRQTKLQNLIDAMRDSPKTKKAKTEDKVYNVSAIYRKYLEILDSGEEIQDMSENFPFIQALIIENRTELPRGRYIAPGSITVEEGPLHPLYLENGPVAGFCDLVSYWTMDIGTSREKASYGVQTLKAIRTLYDGIFSSRYRPEMIAKDLLLSGMYTSGDICAYLVASGADPTKAAAVGRALHGRLAQLKSLSDLTMYSVAGEGVTDNSLPNISRFIDIAHVSNDVAARNLMYSIVYQMSRSDRLTDDSGHYYRRRKYRVSVNQEFVSTRLKTLTGQEASSIFSNVSTIGSDPVFSHVENYGTISYGHHDALRSNKHDEG